MNRIGLCIAVLISLFLLSCTGPSQIDTMRQPSLVLVDFDKDFDISTVETAEADVELTKEKTLLIKTEKAEKPTVILNAPNGKWDLTGFLNLAVDIHNKSKDNVTVLCRVDNPNAAEYSGNSLSAAVVCPNEKQTLKVLFKLKPQSDEDVLRKYLKGMNGLPGGRVWHWSTIDPKNVSRIMICLLEPKDQHVIEIDNIRATDLYSPPSEQELKTSFFPCIDTFGQYMHKDWPGKIQSLQDLSMHRKQEAADLKKHPGPESWNKFGGWQAGPKLSATGYFRVEKYKGKWWLVDPLGRLFFSHGIDCISPHFGYTAVTDRQHYFSSLPDEDSELAVFYGNGQWAPEGNYGERVPCKTYNIGCANLFRKYGPDWEKDYVPIIHKRLRSWGMNTIANWSDSQIYLERKTPYVVHIGGYYDKDAIDGIKFPDPFDPKFRQGLRKRLEQEKNITAGDPWCIGFFIDNELAWGNQLQLPIAVLKAPPTQPAKKDFIAGLKSSYKTLEKLNAAWQTNHTSWDALLQCRQTPDEELARKDFENFIERIAHKYFSICREELKAAAPNNLYLGCRFHIRNPIPLRVAAEYCDVVSRNMYSHGVRTSKLPEPVDKPVIIGEFHFGALDRGPFYPGLRDVPNQLQRGRAYVSYLSGALENPYIVGTHWFQYKDQATTGRSDGENCQVGFVDICDTPYPETIAACRDIGYKLYEYRLESN